MPRTVTLLAVVLAFACGSASAHDFWIEPSTFKPTAGATVHVGLRVGEKLAGEVVPRMPDLVDRFVLVDSRGEAAIPGRPYTDPAGAYRAHDGGLQLAGYQSHGFAVEIDAKTFDRYLGEEGQEHVRATPARKAQGQRAVKEEFHRCAKALLGQGKGAAFDHRVGFTLELVPRRDPTMLDGDRKLPLQLLLRGKPLRGALVTARAQADPQNAVSARTDAQGRVTLPLAHGGAWLVKAVHVEQARPHVAADWESWWSSLVFETPAR